MLDKALKNLRSLTNTSVFRDLRSKSEAITQATLSEKERLIDRMVDGLLEGRDLGDNGPAVRATLRSKLFEQSQGDALFLNNLRYVNKAISASFPSRLSDLSSVKENLIQNLIDEAMKESQVTPPTGRRQSRSRRGSGGGRGSGSTTRRGRGRAVGDRDASSENHSSGSARRTKNTRSHSEGVSTRKAAATTAENEVGGEAPSAPKPRRSRARTSGENRTESKNEHPEKTDEA